MAMALAASLLVVLLASPTVFGTDYTVGDSAGWSLSGDYSTWPTGKTFKVGDNLVFNYDSSHKVDIVDENGYNGCSSSNALKSYQDGNTKIALSSPGKMYFICPQPGHCAGGMKLQITVVAASSNTPTPAAAPAPSGGTPPPESGTPATPNTAPARNGGGPPPEAGTPATPNASSPPPNNNGAVSVSGDIIQLMGSSFVSAIVLAFMS